MSAGFVYGIITIYLNVYLYLYSESIFQSIK